MVAVHTEFTQGTRFVNCALALPYPRDLLPVTVQNRCPFLLPVLHAARSAWLPASQRGRAWRSGEWHL